MLVQLGERLEGLFGWAQHVDVPEHPNRECAATTWFMQLPNQGIGYDHFMLSVVSLADQAGQPPPVRRYPQAEFEVVVFALDADRRPCITDPDTWHVMLPINFVEQFHGISKEQATDVGRALAHACVNGLLMAETQMFFQPADGSAPRMMTIALLADMWRDTVRLLVEHHRTGGLHSRVN